MIECRTENGMATGTLPWSVADRVLARAPGTEVLVVQGAVAAGHAAAGAAGRSVICVIRDPSRHRWQLPVIEAVARQAAAGTPVVLVDVGWPAESPGRPPGCP